MRALRSTGGTGARVVEVLSDAVGAQIGGLEGRATHIERRAKMKATATTTTKTTSDPRLQWSARRAERRTEEMMVEVMNGAERGGNRQGTGTPGRGNLKCGHHPPAVTLIPLVCAIRDTRVHISPSPFPTIINTARRTPITSP